MKAKILLALLVFTLGACQLGAETSHAFPFKKLGRSGGYHIGFVTYDDKPVLHYVDIRSEKIDIKNVTAANGKGQSLEIRIVYEIKDQATLKNPWIRIALTREQVEAATTSGEKITITSGKKSVTASLSAGQFSALLSQADDKDTFTRKKAIAAEIAKREAARKKAEEEKAAQEKERRETYVQENPELGDVIKRIVLEGKLRIGMPRAAAEASWGAPSRRTSRVSASGSSDTWIYQWTDDTATHVYFENEILTSWRTDS